jgi:mersacidin/lichenicidin family type 2 lantibiotic
MSNENIIRAWKDESFRNSISDKMQTLLPEKPAGLVQLTDAELSTAAGGQPAPPTIRRTSIHSSRPLPLFL